MNSLMPYRFLLKCACTLLLLGGIFTSASSQIVINEFQASNSTSIADPDFDDYSDWVELHNTDTKSWNLKGFYLSDNISSPTKWQFPEDAFIPAGGFLIVWADGENTALHTSYRISASGEELALFTPGGKLIDSLSFTPQQTDISFGRNPDGSTDWAYFKTPTPGQSNNTATAYTEVIFFIPSFSQDGGFYSSSQNIELSSDFGGTIRYTTDGSEPVSSSPLYSSPLTINGTTTLRARIFSSGKIPGPTVTQSYFINENSEGEKLPVVSLATDPANFWDSKDGIYVQDFKPDWEIPVNIELFENNGLNRAAFNQMAGVKVNGLYSWQLPQKMLGVYFKKAYGPGNLNYKVTQKRNRSSYKSFALRASGSDWSYTLFRDVLGQHAVIENTDLDIMCFKPVLVYVNGEYLGIHNIREKVDADYIEKNHNLEEGTFDLIENQEFPEAGDITEYNQLIDVVDKDLSNSANYDAVAELIDIENFTDLVITEMAVRNTSIDHNIMSWKPKGTGKWKWVVMDLDRGFFHASNNFIDFYLGQRQLLLSDLFENDGYVDYFAKRLTSQLYTSFNPDRMRGLIDEHEALIESEIPNHIERWKGRTSSYGNAIPSEIFWRNKVNDLRIFVLDRPASLLANMQDYDYSEPATLVVASYPVKAGTNYLEGLKIPCAIANGPILKNMDFSLEANARPGYDFMGWYEHAPNWIIPKEATWKYFTTGSDIGSTWKDPGYGDAGWSAGPAQLGYGDGDENTVISYGGSNSNKYITSYFRKSFSVSNSQIQNGEFFIHLLKDDGAVVYLNGAEIIRANILSGEINYKTEADVSLSSETEDLYISYSVDKNLLEAGDNLIAVELHQESRNSSDVSFDLGLVYYASIGGTQISTNKKFTINLTDDRYLSAHYTGNSFCVIPEFITEDMTLSADCSPYLVYEDVTVLENVTLTVDPGVEIRMPEAGNIFVNGGLNINGTSSKPVIIKLNPDAQSESWGAIVFRNTTAQSKLHYLTIEDAFEGPDPALENAAISAFNADLEMDHLTIEKTNSNPIVARFSDIILTNSSLHTKVTGDCINVKYGTASISNSRFVGNDMPDTDAIDYDEIADGIIRSCTISGFYGFNSDAIDIGEEAQNIQIDSVFAVNITDKGVSLGQKSSAQIKNCVFVNCNMGVAIKDSSRADIRNSIFYSNVYPVACFEKNVGLAGGNATVMNSILSNSAEAPYLSDEKSTIELSYSLSDNIPLPPGHSNVFGNPLFKRPTFFNFELKTGSPGLKSGFSKDGSVNMGTVFSTDEFDPPVVINELFLDGSFQYLPQFISIYNPSEKDVDLSGWEINKGVTALIPEGTILKSKHKLFFTNRADDYLWTNFGPVLIEWQAGQLSENGEAIQLVNRSGIVMDYIEYSISTWPQDGFTGNNVLQLAHPELDNHFPENWTTSTLIESITSDKLFETKSFTIYPNPTSGITYIEQGETGFEELTLYDLRGRELVRVNLQEGTTTINLSTYGSGIYFLKVGEMVEKVVVF